MADARAVPRQFDLPAFAIDLRGHCQTKCTGAQSSGFVKFWSADGEGFSAGVSSCFLYPPLLTSRCILA
jgi:hypothetical protein